jgi:hypothetical protein
MPDQIRIDQGNPLTDDLEDSVPTGKNVLGFFLTYKGETDTDEALNTADLGTLQLDLFEEQRYNVPLGFFHWWTRIHEGAIERTVPTAGTTRLSLFVPLYYAGEPNAIPTRTPRDVQYSVQHNTSALDTAFNQSSTTPSVTLRAAYGADVPFRYIPVFKRSRLPFTGADVDDVEFDESNIPHVYIREAENNVNSQIIDRADITVDGSNTSRRIDDDEIQDGSVVFANTETAPGPWAHKSLLSGAPQQGGYRNTSTSVEVTTNAAGDVYIVRCQRLPKRALQASS